MAVRLAPTPTLIKPKALAMNESLTAIRRAPSRAIGTAGRGAWERGARGPAGRTLDSRTSWITHPCGSRFSV